MRYHFEDRQDAGRQLAAALASYKGMDVIVLALPRGGVPVAAEVAAALDAPLDILVVRKIGAPGQPEFGIGAIVDGTPPTTILSHHLVKGTGASPAYIAAEEQREKAEIERRRSLYRSGPFPSLMEKTVILVDDGIATGATMRAALAGLTGRGVHRKVLAVPVAAEDSLASLAPLVDATVCLATPANFAAVGAHYRHFDQTADEEVIRLMSAARARS